MCLSVFPHTLIIYACIQNLEYIQNDANGGGRGGG